MRPNSIVVLSPSHGYVSYLFRIKHDPEGFFIKQWVAELAACPTAYIYEPWTIPTAEQTAIHILIGVDYPAPIIDIKATGRHARTQLYQPRQSRTNEKS